MIEKDRFKPTLWVYKELMSILAKAGYTHMVFTLFKRVIFKLSFNRNVRNVYLKKKLFKNEAFELKTRRMDRIEYK
jgi:hypothetical protein